MDRTRAAPGRERVQAAGRRPARQKRAPRGVNTLLSMARSYGFDHFTVNKTGPRPPRGKKPQDRGIPGGKRKGAASEVPREASPPASERRQDRSSSPARSPKRAAPRGVSPPPLEAGARRRRDVRDTWMQAGEHARGLREGAEQLLRAGRELVRLPLDLVRALRGAAHEG